MGKIICYGISHPGGYSHTLPIRVCTAQRGRDFEAPDLERDIHFRGCSARQNEHFSKLYFHEPCWALKRPPRVLLRILGGGVPPDSSIKSWAYFRSKNVVFRIRFQTWRRSQNATYVFTKTETMSSSLRLAPKRRHRIRILPFLSYPFGLKLRMHSITHYVYCGSLENYTRFQTKMDKVWYRFSDQIGAQTVPSLGRHRPTYMAYIREYSPRADAWFRSLLSVHTKKPWRKLTTLFISLPPACRLSYTSSMSLLAG